MRECSSLRDTRHKRGAHMTLFERIQAESEHLNDSRLKLAAYLTDNWLDVALMPAREVAANVGVSEAVVIRFCQQLGYPGYPELQAELKQLVRAQMSKPNRAVKHLSRDNTEISTIIRRDLEREITNLEGTAAKISGTDVDRAAEILINARLIAVMGWRNSGAVINILGAHLNELFGNVKYANPFAAHPGEVLLGLGPSDVLLVLCCRRYSKQVVEAVNMASEIGVKIIAFTDSIASPVAPPADVTFVTRNSSHTFASSHVATVFLFYVLVSAVITKSPDLCKRNLEAVEQMSSRLCLIQ